MQVGSEHVAVTMVYLGGDEDDGDEGGSNCDDGARGPRLLWDPCSSDRVAFPGPPDVHLGHRAEDRDAVGYDEAKKEAWGNSQEAGKERGERSARVQVKGSGTMQAQPESAATWLCWFVCVFPVLPVSRKPRPPVAKGPWKGGQR